MHAKSWILLFYRSCFFLYFLFFPLSLRKTNDVETHNKIKTTTRKNRVRLVDSKLHVTLRHCVVKIIVLQTHYNIRKRQIVVNVISKAFHYWYSTAYKRQKRCLLDLSPTISICLLSCSDPITWHCFCT